MITNRSVTLVSISSAALVVAAVTAIVVGFEGQRPKPLVRELPVPEEPEVMRVVTLDNPVRQTLVVDRETYERRRTEARGEYRKRVERFERDRPRYPGSGASNEEMLAYEIRYERWRRGHSSEEYEKAYKKGLWGSTFDKRFEEWPVAE